MDVEPHLPTLRVGARRSSCDLCYEGKVSLPLDRIRLGSPSEGVSARVTVERRSDAGFMNLQNSLVVLD